MDKQNSKQEGQSNFCPNCEALARELKAIKQEQGEPVAWCVADGEDLMGTVWENKRLAMVAKRHFDEQYGTANADRRVVPLYTTQQHKPLWIDPNNKTQAKFMPNIGEPVLFCHGGKTYCGRHTGGSFQYGAGVTKRDFNTWECLWMYLPAAHGIAPQGSDK